MAHRLLTSQQRNACWEKRSRTQNCSRLLRWPAINWKQQFWIYNMRIASENSTTAAQTIFMICPGSVNVLSMGNTLRCTKFFSALKEITACHIIARAKKSYDSTLYHTYKPITERTYVPAYLCTYLHTHLRNCTHVHAYTRTYIHTNTRTHFLQ